MEVKIVDKRGTGGNSKSSPDQPPAPQEPQDSYLKEKVTAPGEGSAPAALEGFIAEIDNLSLGQAFWVRGVEYRVVELLKDGLKIIPISLDRQTMKRLRRLQREAKKAGQSNTTRG